MTTKTLFRLMPALLVLLVLSACSDKGGAPLNAPAGTNKTPAGAVTSLAALLKAGNIDGMLKASVPDNDYQAVRKAYDSSEFKTKPVSDAERVKFAAQMEKLTAPGAKAALFNDAKPVLAEYDSKYRAMIPMYVGMGQTMAANAIDKSTTMGPEEKTQAKALMAQMAQWMQTTNWGDQNKAQQAIGIAVDAARTIDVKTFAQARALTYDQAMAKSTQYWVALKQIFGLYGLNIDKTLDSVQAKTLSSTADKAIVQYSYKLFDVPMKGEVTLVQRDGHWYNLDFIAKVEEGLLEANSSAPATASSPAK